MIVGFTGTKRGMNSLQQQKVYDYFEESHPTEFHHGVCVGADEQAHRIANEVFGISIIGHPPINLKYVAPLHVSGFLCILENKEYLKRNHDIVDACDVLLATPGELAEQLRSGTWATIRYARKMKKPIVIIRPDGEYVYE